MRHVMKVGVVSALVFASAAAADDGWTGFAGAGIAPTSRAEAAPTFADSTSDGDLPAGAPGPQGPQGPPGEKGDKGDPGVNADLCQNLPGIQTTPVAKYNAQRFWSFLPKWERRFLAVNRKGQLVCVTQRWINTHKRALRSVAS